jgi:hypothetical protein
MWAIALFGFNVNSWGKEKIEKVRRPWGNNPVVFLN